ASCGKGGNKNAKKDAGTGAPVAAPISLPVLGVDKITRFSFIYDTGAAAAKKAADAAAKKDWAEARKQAEAALAKDPNHLDAHRTLAIALAQSSEHAAAVDHLVAGIAADYFKYGTELAGITELAAQIKDEYTKRIKAGLWLIGRRSSFKWPEKPGVQSGSSKGELYAFDRETKRYLRLTHTGDQVAGFVLSKAGNEVAILGYDKINRTKDDAPPLIGRAWIQSFDTTEWKNTSPKITLAEAR